MAWEPPAEIGDYRLRRRIGEGGMGQVWLGEDVALGRRVAVKFPTGLDGARAEDRRSRFVLEGQALARVSHPNILAVYHAGLFQDHPYLITEYLSGSPLASMPQPFSPKEVLEVATQLARALAAVHRAGILHRDISPANVVRTKLGKIKLIDFGLATQPNPTAAVAKKEDDEEVIHQTVGAAAYLAPEIWMNDPSTRLSDIYALGATLFHLATSRPPFVAPSIDKLWTMVMTRPVPPVRSLAREMSPQLAEIIDRCLDRDPIERYQSADEIAAALDVLSRAPPAKPSDTHAPPYRGLESFEEQHQDDFFGRDREIALVLERLKESGFAAVIGSSGAGKTSLLRAGLIPQIAAGALDGRPTRVHHLKPKSESISALIKTLEETKGESVLLVFDQLEETLTDADAAVELGALLERLVVIGPDLRILIGLRSDAVSQLEGLGVMRSALVNNAIVLGPLRGKALQKAVTGPLERRGYRFDPPELVEQLTAGAESLPLLSFALSKLWQERDETARVLSEAALKKIGGIEGALTQHAEETFQRLPEALHQDAETILVSVALGEKPTGPTHPAALAALIGQRLVVAKEDQVALAHPILAESWGRLRAWIDREASTRALRARLQRAALEWDRMGRRSEELWRGRRLAALKHEPLPELEEIERIFVESSVRAERKETFARWRMRLGLSALVLVVLLGTLVAWRVDAMFEAEKIIAQRLSDARPLLEAAKKIRAETRQIGQEAFAAFDRGDAVRGEQVWAAALAAEEQVNDAFLEASETIESALAVAPGALPIREIAAETYYEWWLAASRSNQAALARELRARLAEVDDRGFLQRLNAPATLRLTGAPAEGTGVIYRVISEKSGRKILTDPQTAAALNILEPGSYLIEARAPGRVVGRFPIVLEPGEQRREVLNTLTASEVPKGFIQIPGGSGLVGSSAHEVARKALGAQPQHNTHVDSFLIHETEITVGQYSDYLNTLDPEERSRRRPRGEDLAANFPVSSVSFDDAEAYAAWLAKTNRVPGARLCKSREWERAARGADGRLYPAGDQLLPGDANVKTPGSPQKVVEVGSFEWDISPFGVRDMAGNLFEWVVTGPSDAPRSALRGGAFDAPPELAQSSGEGPAGDHFHATVGFRICAEITASTARTRD